MNITYNTGFNSYFEGRVIVHPKSFAKKQMKEFATQYNQMKIVKNSMYNVYIGKGNDIWNDSLTVRVLATKGKTNNNSDLFIKGIPSVFSKESIQNAIKTALKKK